MLLIETCKISIKVHLEVYFFNITESIRNFPAIYHKCRAKFTLIAPKALASHYENVEALPGKERCGQE